MSVTNVKDFGAIGDGVTDDTQAFLDALDILLNTFEKGILYCPSGTYKISQQLVIDKPYISIKGDGVHVSTLKFWNASSNGLKISALVTDDNRWSVVEDITIDGPGFTPDDPMAGPLYSNVGIDMENGYFCFLNRFHVLNFDIGVLGNRAILSKFENFSVEGCRIGMQFVEKSYMVTILNGNVRGCTEVGIHEDGSKVVIAMSDIEAIGVFNPSTGLYEGGISIKTGLNTEIRECHFELSEVGIGLASPFSRVCVENCYLGACATGVKNVYGSTIGGYYYFKNIMFDNNNTEFDIPAVNVYQIEDCHATYVGGAEKTVSIIGDSLLDKYGTVKDVQWSADGFWITHEALGMKVRDRQVWHGKYLLESIAVGTVNANSTASFTVTDPASSLTEWSDVVNVAIQSYTLPAGLILTGYVQPFSTSTIGIHVTNTTGSNINVGTRNFIIKTM